MSMSLNTVMLENTFGRVVALVEGVTNDDLLSVFDRLCELARDTACPIIFVNGHGYTSRTEFLEFMRTINTTSVEMGGCNVYPQACVAAEPAY